MAPAPKRSRRHPPILKFQISNLRSQARMRPQMHSQVKVFPSLMPHVPRVTVLAKKRPRKSTLDLAQRLHRLMPRRIRVPLAVSSRQIHCAPPTGPRCPPRPRGPRCTRSTASLPFTFGPTLSRIPQSANRTSQFCSSIRCSTSSRDFPQSPVARSVSAISTTPSLNSIVMPSYFIALQFDLSEPAAPPRSLAPPLPCSETAQGSTHPPPQVPPPRSAADHP